MFLHFPIIINKDWNIIFAFLNVMTWFYWLFCMWVTKQEFQGYVMVL